MAAPLLYLTQPNVTDLPAGTPAGSLAWFARWSSGHLSHADQALVNWAASQNVFATSTKMAWSEYQRLLAESHWYESA